MKIHRLRVNHFENPMGLGEREAEWSWELPAPSEGHNRQTACRVIAASSKSAAADGKGDWGDSGQMESQATTFYCTRFHAPTIRATDRSAVDGRSRKEMLTGRSRIHPNTMDAVGLPASVARSLKVSGTSPENRSRHDLLQSLFLRPFQSIHQMSA